MLGGGTDLFANDLVMTLISKVSLLSILCARSEDGFVYSNSRVILSLLD